ncbi:MAG: hypothetical protein IIC75_04700 [Bacteroidetes bacterium]|nr:hypothetical protein [Bacteroidota bacterium]
MENIDLLDKYSKENFLSYLYLIKNEFWEVNDFINTLYNHKPFALDIRSSDSVQNALNIAVVISYSRNFKTNFGFNKAKKINAELIKPYTAGENKLHKMILDLRDTEFAHSDALPNDIQIYEENNKSYSRRVVRQLLEKIQLEMLKEMVNKIREEIEVYIKYLI